jgi:hypothetical protein
MIETIKDLPIRQFKLMNGDEIIALVESDNESNYLIDRPFRIMINTTKTDLFNLVPWFDLSLSNTFTIDKSMVVAHAAVADQIKESYLRFALKLEDINASLLDDDDDYDDDDTPALIPDKPKTVH